MSSAMRHQVKGLGFSFQWSIQQLMESCRSLVEVRAIQGSGRRWVRLAGLLWGGLSGGDLVALVFSESPAESFDLRRVLLRGDI